MKNQRSCFHKSHTNTKVTILNFQHLVTICIICQLSTPSPIPQPQKCITFFLKCYENRHIHADFLLTCSVWSGADLWTRFRSWKMLQHEYSHIFTKFHLQRSLKNNDFSPRGAELAIRGAALEERWRVPHAVTAAAWAAGPPQVGVLGKGYGVRVRVLGLGG